MGGVGSAASACQFRRSHDGAFRTGGRRIRTSQMRVGHGEVTDHQPVQRLRRARAAAAASCPRRGAALLVSWRHTAHSRDIGTGVHSHHEGRRSPPQRLVRELPGETVSRGTPTFPAASTPLIGLHTTGQHRPVRGQVLPGHLQPELRQAERTSSDQGPRSLRRTCRGLPGGRRINLHPRETSTPIHRPTRGQVLHPHL